MSKDTENKLINFYSEYNIKEAESQDGKKTLLEIFEVNDYYELLRVNEYTKHFDNIGRHRKELDDQMVKKDGIDQVQSCLALLNRNKKSKKYNIEILAKLIKNEKTEKSQYYFWSKQQKAHYDEAFPIIVGWQDCFLSYTDWGLPQTNNDFRDVIIHSLKKNDFKRDINEKNYVAKLLAKHLTDNGLQIFYAPSDKNYNDSIKKEIFEQCKSCYVFLQLIEKKIFYISESKENLCYFAFKEFDNYVIKQTIIEGRYHFIKTHKDVFPKDDISEEYKHWITTIKEKRCCTIYRLDSFELRSEIDNLAQEIINTRNKILKEYLGDYLSK